jgi:hypothetical protein
MSRIAVVTPYHREPLEMLERCHRSVLAQEPRADHFMVADGFPRAEVANWDVRHMVLPGAHADGGAVARGLGSLLAEADGYDFIAYLDADNWFHERHLASLLELHQRSGAPVCTCFRTFHAPDGSLLEGVTEVDEDRLQHIDTSCFLVHRSAFGAMPVWSRMPRQLGMICDRVFLAALKHGRFPIVSTRERTLAYRTLHELHYTRAGLAVPEGVKSGTMIHAPMQWMLTREGVDECVRVLGFWPMTYL